MSSHLTWDDLWDAMKAKPDNWHHTTADMYNDMLEILPPVRWRAGSFLVGEPYSHDRRTGEAIYACFQKRPSGYWARYMTTRVFDKTIN